MCGRSVWEQWIPSVGATCKNCWSNGGVKNQRSSGVMKEKQVWEQCIHTAGESLNCGAERGVCEELKCGVISVGSARGKCMRTVEECGVCGRSVEQMY